MTAHRLTKRRMAAIFAAMVIVIGGIASADDMWQPVNVPVQPSAQQTGGTASAALETLEVKGRAPKTEYARTKFGSGWAEDGGCDMRNAILQRDLTAVVSDDGCRVLTGVLHDPYTGKTISFQRGEATSDDVQIDHVVALSDAWQKGAQQLSQQTRILLANDPLELIAVDGQANQDKSDADAATWLPPQKAFRCQYVARQIAVKAKYGLWVTPAEKQAMNRILTSCPGQPLPT